MQLPFQRMSIFHNRVVWLNKFEKLSLFNIKPLFLLDFLGLLRTFTMLIHTINIHEDIWFAVFIILFL